jgi:hypothetical protein
MKPTLEGIKIQPNEPIPMNSRSSANVFAKFNYNRLVQMF